MSEYQLELKQIVDYPRCRIYRQFIGLLMKDKSIRVGGTSGLYHFTVLSCFANFRTSYKRIDGISYTIYPGEWLCRVSELTEWFRTRFQHQALAILRELQDRHLITYTLLGRGRLVKFKIKGWCKYNRVLEYNAPCQKDTGFFFLPISVANELVSAGRCSEMDAMLDLWINTVYNDTQVQGSEVGPVVYMRNGTGSPLIGYAELAQRWGVSKATAGRYLRKMQELDYLSILLNWVWQLFKNYGLSAGIEAEDPVKLSIRSILFILLAYFADEIVNIILKIGGTPYQWILNSELPPLDFASFNSVFLTILGVCASGTVALIALILILILAWNYIKLLFEAAERYVLLGVLVFTAPVAFAMGASQTTSNIFKSWCRMFGGQVFLLLMNAWCLRLFTSMVGQFLSNPLAL